MEVSGVAFRRVPCLSGAVIDAHSAKPAVSVGPSEFRDAAEVLMKQLQHLRAEDDLKRKSKQETSKLDCESESSESSDSECEEVIDMSCLRSEPHEEPAQPDELQSVTQENATTLTLSSWLTEEGNTTEANGLGNCRSENNEVECCTKISTSCSSISSNVGHNDISSIATGAQRIEVCMGKKCKKSGGPALLEEFGRVIGVEGAVVECKCLGKCKDGPNVRVLNCADGSQAEGLDVSVRAPTNPLVLGVALQDVGVIVSNFFGDDQKDLAAAA
ncbi:hypothetical protein FH972_015740 [Carpinus fangiana]|uniref:Uncharacterized protein n=1 Tax=Carpinus fangiana TaxID=176857 RepID=A0A5N6REA2_9ROSI|nr:hypothetical protein FH972_015740 [Carpinus fangiana]